MTRRPAAEVLLLVTALAAGLRLWNLGGRSLWVDEIVAWEGQQHSSLGGVLGWVATDQMPLFYVLEWLARGLGPSEAAIRAVPAVCAILLVPALYAFVRRVAGTQAALWAALCAAVSPFLVWYAQDATAYSLLLLTSTVAAWAAHRAEERSRLPDWLLLSLAAALTAYAHFSGLLVVAALYAWALASALSRRDGVRALGALTSGAVAAALLAPWSPWIRAYLTYAPPLAAKASAHGFPLALQPIRLAWGLGLLPLVLPLALAGAVALARRRREALLLALWIAVPAAGVAAAGGLAALALPERYFAATTPGVMALAGIGAAALVARVPRPPRLVPAAWGAVVVTAAALPQLLLWYGEPKDDWRGAASVIAARAEPRSTVVVLGYGTLWSRRDIAYYLGRDGRALPVVDVTAGVDPAAVEVLRRGGPVFAVFNTADGPPDLRLDGRSATGDFTRIPPGSPTVTVRRQTGVAVAAAPDAAALLEWAATAVPGARAWASAVEAGAGD